MYILSSNRMWHVCYQSPPNMIFTLFRMESLLGSYGCSLLGISRIAGTGCNKTQRTLSDTSEQISKSNAQG